MTSIQQAREQIIERIARASFEKLDRELSPSELNGIDRTPSIMMLESLEISATSPMVNAADFRKEIEQAERQS